MTSKSLEYNIGDILTINYLNRSYIIKNSIVHNIEHIKEFIISIEKLKTNYNYYDIIFENSYINENNFIILINSLRHSLNNKSINIWFSNNSIYLINNIMNKNNIYEYCYNIIIDNDNFICSIFKSSVEYRCRFFISSTNIKTLQFGDYYEHKIKRNINIRDYFEISNEFFQILLNNKNKKNKIQIIFGKCYLDIEFDIIKNLLQDYNILISDCITKDNYKILCIKDK